MKGNILLISNCERTHRKVREAARLSGRKFRRPKTIEHMFVELRDWTEHPGVIVLDLDPGGPGLAVLEAIGSCPGRPPVIVLTSLEESGMTPVVQRHGASGCLGKPFTAEELAALIEQISAETSDLWGHPHRERHFVSRSLVA